MIPKIIHYCWFGEKPLPELAEKCIASWKKFCPDYKIKRWDESNTNLTENDYIREAYENKKWAFITDYIRLKVLYEFGGIYMDTDVQVCKSLDSFLTESAFSGFENDHQIPTGIMASEKEHPFFKKLLEYYVDRHFVLDDGTFDQTTNVIIITEIGLKNGFIPNDQKQTFCDMTFYPHDVFCPKSHLTGEIQWTDNTVCIHHFDGSWKTEKERKDIIIRQKLNQRFGLIGDFIYKLQKYTLHPLELYKRLHDENTPQ